MPAPIVELEFRISNVLNIMVSNFGVLTLFSLPPSSLSLSLFLSLLSQLSQFCRVIESDDDETRQPKGKHGYPMVKGEVDYRVSIIN